MTPVHLAGRGLVSSLGPDLAAAVAALRDGPRPPAWRTVGDGPARPFHAITDTAATAEEWWPRAERLVRAAVAESGALHGDRAGPLFVASSSVDVGARQHAGDFAKGFDHLAHQVAAWLQWRGPVFTVSTACTSASNAVLSATRAIASGDACEALVLGIELENGLTLGGFASMQLLSREGARPLGLGRDGLALGEAVAALFLSAAPARWRMAGGANVVDGSDPAGAVHGAVVDLCRRALAHAGLCAADIDVAKLQAAGSPVNDATEVAAMREVFQPMPALVSLKAALGHTLGASGAAEIALITAALEADVWPAPSCAPDPMLGVTLAAAAPARLRHVLATILGFGGGHTAIVLEDRGAA